MTPPSIDIDHARSVSAPQRYWREHSDPPQSELALPPSPTSEASDCESILSSGSEDFNEKGIPKQSGLPSFYQSGSHLQVDTANLNSSSTGLIQGPMLGTSKSRNWRRHFFGWRVVLMDSWLNALLFMIPTAWTIRLTMEHEHTFVFSFCILALIPLVRLHDLTIEQLALRIGGSKTALLNASMSNFIEIVLAISALRKCELRVVQSSLVGSILSKLLLILGLCFFGGGLRFSEQGFDPTATQVHSSLLSISVAVLLLPAAYHFTLSNGNAQNADLQKRDILKMSHGVSVILILTYLCYLAFQLWSHTHLYQDNHNKKSTRLPATQNISAGKTAAYLSARSRSTLQSCKNLADFDNISIRSSGRSRSRSKSTLTPPKRPYVSSAFPASGLRNSSSSLDQYGSADEFPSLRPQYGKPESTDQTRTTFRFVGTRSNASGSKGEDRGMATGACLSPVGSTFTMDSGNSEWTRVEEVDRVKPKKEPQLSWFLTISMMLLVTAAVAITADWLVESMDGISTMISKEWVALILLPAVSSIAECITAVRVSVRDELATSVSVAVGSTIQTALLVIPFMVLLGLAIGKPLTLLMDPFESLVLYLSVQTTSYVLADGKSNWLEGCILVSLYLIIAVSFWFYPGSTPLDFLTVCPHD